MLHDRKALLRQPVKLLHARGMLRRVQSVDRAICSVCSGLRGIRMRSHPRCLRSSSRFRRHQRKGKELHMPLCRNLIVELAHRAGTQIARVLVFRAFLLEGLIDFFKIAVGDHCLAAQHQTAAVWNPKRQVGKDSGIACDDFADLTIPARNRLDQHAVLIGQHDRQSVQLPRKHAVLCAEPVHQCIDVLGLI